MAAPLTEAAIEQVRELITTGELVPGQRLPPEAELAEALGTGRSTVREAVRALVTARVLDVRRGDGTFVTSLRPELLLAGIGAAADLLQHGFTLELVQVRRILEPAATAMAAARITDEPLAELERAYIGCLPPPRRRRARAVRRGVPPPGRRRRRQRNAGLDAQTACPAAPPAAGRGAASSRRARPNAPSPSTPGSCRRLRAHDPQLAEAAALLHVRPPRPGSAPCWPQQPRRTPDGRLIGRREGRATQCRRVGARLWLRSRRDAWGTKFVGRLERSGVPPAVLQARRS